MKLGDGLGFFRLPAPELPNHIAEGSESLTEKSLGTLDHAGSQATQQWVAIGISTACHVLGLGVVILLGIAVPSGIERLTQKPPAYVQLLIPAMPLEVPTIREPSRVSKLEVPKLTLPKIPPPFQPPERPTPLPEAPKVPAHVQPMDWAPLAAASTGLPPSPASSIKTERPRQLPEVRTGILTGRTAVAEVKLLAREVQTGGFGSPTGLSGEAEGGSRGNVPKLGSFDLPPGDGYGNGSGGTHGARGTVASAGFGPLSASAGEGDVSTSGSRQPFVRPSGFDVKPTAQTPAAQRRLPQKPILLPVEILSKPNPVYTEEARKLALQGEVVLSVVFTASGKMQVLSVVQGLGHGLDEAAWHAAEQIRFKPAERDGQPVDFPATLRVVFQLANQPKSSGDQS